MHSLHIVVLWCAFATGRFIDIFQCFGPSITMTWESTLNWLYGYFGRSGSTKKLWHNHNLIKHNNTLCIFDVMYSNIHLVPLQWRHNECDGISNHRRLRCLLNRLFRRRSKKISQHRVTGLCEGKSLGPMNSPHRGPVTQKMSRFDDVIMRWNQRQRRQSSEWQCKPCKPSNRLV